jgi:purine-binding chemotaxis protein CheW
MTPDPTAHPLVPRQPAEPEAIRQFCTFRLAGRRFGVDILHVQEVALVPPLTPAHHAPPLVAGVANMRGQIVLCLAMRRLLGLPPADLTPEARLVLFKPVVAGDVGALVDEVGDIAEIPAAEVERRRADASGAEEEGDGVGSAVAVGEICKLDGELLLILDPSRLLAELDAAFDHAERHGDAP